MHLVNGQACQFCLICQADSLDNIFGEFACQTCLGNESEVDLIKVCDLKRRSFLSQRRIWSPIFAHINTKFLQVRDYVVFVGEQTVKILMGKSLDINLPGQT